MVVDQAHTYEMRISVQAGNCRSVAVAATLFVRVG
jgi:hypothetical protein